VNYSISYFYLEEGLTREVHYLRGTLESVMCAVA